MGLVDIDGFKGVNDSYGHLAGDKVLRSLGNIWVSETRDNDVVARYGGDEIAVIFESGINGALDATRRIKKRINGHSYTFTNTNTGETKDVIVTQSIGLASIKDIPEIPLMYGERGADMVASFLINQRKKCGNG